MSIIPQLYNQGTGLIGSTTEGNNLPESVKNLIVQDTLTVLGDSTFNGLVTINNNLDVNGIITAQSIVANNISRKLQTLIVPYTVISTNSPPQSLLGTGVQVIGNNQIPNNLQVGDTFTVKSSGQQSNTNNGLAIFYITFGNTTSIVQQSSINQTLGTNETGYNLDLTFTILTIGVTATVSWTLIYTFASGADDLQGRVFSDELTFDSTQGGNIDLLVTDDIGTGNPVTFIIKQAIITT
jgi:hypothetical protein